METQGAQRSSSGTVERSVIVSVLASHGTLDVCPISASKKGYLTRSGSAM